MPRIVVRRYKGSDLTTHEEFRAAFQKLPRGVYTVSGLSRGWGTRYDVTQREADLAAKEHLVEYMEETAPDQPLLEFNRGHDAHVRVFRRVYIRRTNG